MDKTLEVSIPEKMLSGQPAIQHIIAKYAGQFDAAWVYGSYALGIQTKESDIDILFYRAGIEKPFKESLTLGNTPVSLNFFGSKNINNRENQRQNGLYFITRFLAPTQFIGGNASVAATIEQQSFIQMLYWVQYFLQPQVSIHELSNGCLLSLIYLLKIKMHQCYLMYFNDWFQCPRFTVFWNSKIVTLKRVTQTYRCQQVVTDQPRQHIGFARFIELQELIAQFWKFSYAFRDYDETHISAYHQKQIKRIDDSSWPQVNKVRDHLLQQSLPYGLVGCLL
ncbi:nucleotidyltransferase domain-containing protein [Paraflavitalea pollutisoli]|uniref:nucleotidyltransferase domain-containing protein n=1 Tax=Paraflavitalea pollutisoli TaxID=3034143 RepID=UPI0023EB4A02|nr:nucleotidyltransferase domain-containing protein [Paraflavitalea sp. H1-2-19X]